MKPLLTNYMQYRNLVETICRGMPNVTRYPLENEDQLKATDEQSKKKQVLKERKKVEKNTDL